MEKMESADSSLKKIKWLTKVCLFSGALNLIFVFLFTYFFIKENPFTGTFDYTPTLLPPSTTTEFSNLDLLRKMVLLPQEKLSRHLQNQEIVEEGYKIRDLALSLLVRRDHFDVKRALHGKKIATRTLLINEKTNLTLFPGLSDDDFNQIIAFYKREKWPLTSRGLFLQLSKNKQLNDETLFQACAMTPEFMCVEVLFKDAKAPIKKKWLLAMLAEGKWEFLSRFAVEQRQALVLGEGRKREFLLNYLRSGSPTAASIFLLLDFDYCLKRMHDGDVCKILDLLPKDSKRGELFAQKLLSGSRGEAVFSRAKLRINSSAGAGAATNSRTSTATKKLR